MTRSSATFVDGALVVELSPAARLLGFATRRSPSIDSWEIVGTWRSDARFVGRRLRWKIVGTAVWRQRAMGWFSWIGHRRRWAWVWLTPGREVLVVERVGDRPALVVVPLDWFTSIERDTIVARTGMWAGESRLV